MHKPESIIENEKQKILWAFEIQSHHLILARRPDLVLINKKKELSIYGILLFHWAKDVK